MTPWGSGYSSFSAIIALLLAALGAAGCHSRPQSSESARTLTSSDGVSLAAHCYRPRGEKPPGIILVHGAGQDRHVWSAFAVEAQQWGYLVVTLDLRGHGDSRTSTAGPLDFRNFDEAAWQAMTLDIDAAFVELRAQGANPDDLFLAGEGFGANLALKYAVEHRDIQGVVLLSAGADYHGLKAIPTMEMLATRPALLLWGERDDYAASCGAALEQRAPGHLEVRVYPGTAQGADLFTTSPEAMGQVLVWLDQMRVKPAFSTG